MECPFYTIRFACERYAIYLCTKNTYIVTIIRQRNVDNTWLKYTIIPKFNSGFYTRFYFCIRIKILSVDDKDFYYKKGPVQKQKMFKKQ